MDSNRSPEPDAQDVAAVREALVGLYHYTAEGHMKKGRSEVYADGIAALDHLAELYQDREGTSGGSPCNDPENESPPGSSAKWQEALETLREAVLSAGPPKASVKRMNGMQAIATLEAALRELEARCEEAEQIGAIQVRELANGGEELRVAGLALERAEATLKQSNLDAMQNAAQRDLAQAEVERLREALQMLWDHYLLVISDEQKKQVRAALSPAGEAETETTFDYLGPDPDDPESGERWGETETE